MIYRLALSGLINSGKDYVAEKLGYKRMSVAKALYALAWHFFHDEDYKNKQDLRMFLQQVGQWGWGYHNPTTCPYTVERALFCNLIRDSGALYTGMTEYDWRRFGLVKTFWIDGLLRFIETNHSLKTLIAITNVRYAHELEPIIKFKYEYFLVTCSEETRRKRCGGELPPYSINYNISELFARELERKIEPNRIIWNDDVPKPVAEYLTVEEFQKIAMKTD